jgi:hypothetical protein
MAIKHIIVLFVETPRKFITAELLKNNLDIVLALFTTLNHRFPRLDTTVQFKPQQVQLQTWFRSSSQPFMVVSSTSKTVLNSYD